MKPNQLRIAAVLFMLLFAVVVRAQGWDYEKQRTLAEMITLRRVIIDQRHPVFSGAEAGEFALNNSAVTSRVKLSYLGKRRQLSSARRRLLDGIARTYALNPDSVKGLVEEVLYRESDKEYWIPTKKEIISALEERMKTGDEGMLYIDLVGAYRNNREWEWVFTANEIA